MSVYARFTRASSSAASDGSIAVTTAPCSASSALASPVPQPRLRNLAICAALVCAGFLLANPYALLDRHEFHAGLTHQSTAAGDSTGKLGLTQDNGIVYYLWTLAWGLGWVPAAAALGGAVTLARRDWRMALVLAPAPILFILFMGTQARFFGRWLLPVLPIVCLLAAYGAVAAASLVRGRARLAAFALAAGALLGQALVYTVHNDLVLSRPDTRNVARAWMVARVPPRTKVVVEPGVVPDQWAHDPGRPNPATSNGNRWVKFSTSRSTIDNQGRVLPGGRSRLVNVEDYERTLRPALIRAYEAGQYCWVVSGSTQSGRAFAEPGKVPRAIAYYRELGRRSRIAYRASPYDPGAGPVKFNFDWSFDYYPLAYHRPGPVVTIYRLTGGRCAPVSSR
jgi:hypothetical protein